MMNNTNAFDMNKECGGTRNAGMSLTSNLNSLDTIFIFKDTCHIDNKFYNKMVDSVATNNYTGHSAFSRLQTISGVLIFIAFILILSSYTVNEISLSTILPKCSCARVGIDAEDATSILKEIGIKNINRVIIGTLNINS